MKIKEVKKKWNKFWQSIDKHWPRAAGVITVIAGIIALINFLASRPDFYLDSSKIDIGWENNAGFYLKLPFKNVGKRTSYNVFPRGFVFDKDSLLKEVNILGIILSENIPSGEILYYRVNPFKVPALTLSNNKYLVIYFKYQDKWQYPGWFEQYFIWKLNYLTGMEPLTKKEREKIEPNLKIQTKKLLKNEFEKEYK